MITEKDVWHTFQVKKGKNVEYPSDKKWESIYKRLSSENKYNIETLVKYLNTVWQNINLERYIEVGFRLWKTFSYKHLLREEIINKYKELDKSKKRKNVKNTTLRSSFQFIVYNRFSLSYYGSIKDDGFSLAISDYLQGHIDALIVVYMLEKRYLQINTEYSFIPYIVDKYDEIRDRVNEKWDLLNSMEKVIISKQEQDE